MLLLVPPSQVTDGAARRLRSVGLAPTKSKNLIALSQQLLDRFDGQVPDTFEGLQSLPGVGKLGDCTPPPSPSLLSLDTRARDASSNHCDACVRGRSWVEKRACVVFG